MVGVDEARLDSLRRSYAERMRRASAESRYKYLDVAFFTLQKLLLARQLGLHRGPARRVLDIGTGGGHFPWVCRFYGHQSVAIDVKNTFYDSLAACFDVQRIVVPVEAQTPLPDLGGRFDLITACGIVFNEKSRSEGRRVYWSIEEWRFFLNDLVAHQLGPSGTIFLKLNKEERSLLPGLQRHSYSREALTLATRNGAQVRPRLGTIRLTFTTPRDIR